MERFGIASDQIAQALPPPGWSQDSTSFTVLPENWPTVRVFCMQAGRWERNQWTGSVICLHLPSVESTMRILRIPVRDRDLMLEDLIEMQKAARPILNKALEKSQ